MYNSSKSLRSYKTSRTVSKNQEVLDFISSRVMPYLILFFPVIVAGDLLYLSWALEQIPNFKSPLDNLFQAGLLFVISTSIAAIYTTYVTDRRINRLESTGKKIASLEFRLDKKIEQLESRLNEIISNQETKICDCSTKIEILTQIDLLKSELEREKTSQLKN